MKKSIWTLLMYACLLCFSFHILHGQVTLKSKKDQYKIWITKMDKSKKLKGYLFDAGDSLVTVMNYSAIGGSQNVEIGNIDKIKLRKKGKPGRGLLYGALVGFSIGAVIGFASGDDPSGGFFSFTAGQKAILAGTLLTIPGAIVGLVVGHGMSVKIPIKGNRNTYQSQRERLEQYKLVF